MSGAKPGGPLETFTVPRVYAIAEKSGKVEYELDAQNPEQTITCAHSLFPRARYSPCWYIKPRSQRPIPMAIFPPALQELRGSVSCSIFLLSDSIPAQKNDQSVGSQRRSHRKKRQG